MVNGKSGEYVRWLAGLALAAVVAYFTTINTIERQIADVRAREDAHFQELLRRLDQLQGDIRELRARP